MAVHHLGKMVGGGSNPLLSSKKCYCISTVECWCHIPMILVRFQSVVRNMRLYTLCLISSGKVSWLHAGSIPVRRTNKVRFFDKLLYFYRTL